MSEEKFSKCKEGLEKKNISVEFRVFGKKKNWRENFRGKKRIKVFLGGKRKLKLGEKKWVVSNF